MSGSHAIAVIRRLELTVRHSQRRATGVAETEDGNELSQGRWVALRADWEVWLFVLLGQAMTRELTIWAITFAACAGYMVATWLAFKTTNAYPRNRANPLQRSDFSRDSR